MKKRLSKQPLRMVTSPVALSSAEIYSTLTDFTDRCWRHTCSTTTHGVKTAAHNCVENNSSLFNKVNKAENIYESTHTHTKKNIVNTLLQMKKNPKTCYLIEYGRRYQNPEMFEDSLFYEPLNSILLENGFTSVLSVDQLLIAVNRHSSPGKSIYIPQLIWCCLRNNIFDITPHLFSWFKVWDWAVHAMKLILVVWNQDVFLLPGVFRVNGLLKPQLQKHFRSSRCTVAWIHSHLRTCLFRQSAICCTIPL